MLLLVSLWNDPDNFLFGCVGLAGFKSRANAFLAGLIFPYSICLLLCSLFFPSLGWLGGVGVFRVIEFSLLSPGLVRPIQTRLFYSYN